MKPGNWGKFAGLAFVLALLLTGLVQIQDIVHDRQSQQRTAISSVASSLAGPQALLGPIIHRSCVEEWDIKPDANAATGRREFRQIALPSNLTIDADSALEARKRGPYTAQAFNMTAKLNAQWPDLDALRPERKTPGSRLTCGSASVMVAMSDARGIRNAVLKVNSILTPTRAGTDYPPYPRGIRAALPASVDLAAPMAVQIDLEIVGTEQVAVVPVAAATLFKLSSNWPHPSFGGDFLPVDRTITMKGFAAQWRVSSLASSAQQDVALGRVLCTNSNPAQTSSEASGGTRSAECLETVSVAFIDPVNTYVLSDRATKYGVLFIALTFVAVGLFEFMCALRVHPIQYLLVGAAISLFFLLLLSLSEHLPFSIAYAAAGSACVLLLGYYASYMLHSWRRGLPFGLGMATLYGLLYLLLQLEQTALIVGSLALFALLALIMTLTRRVDWYARLRLPQADLPQQPA